MDISIIICCYNSSSRISATLRHIANQQVAPNIKWEVIVVDNKSTDDTSKITKQVWENSGCSSNFSIVYEPKPGLSFARKKGTEVAQGAILLFCDDDNWLDYNYLQLGYQVMASNSCIGMLGGIGREVMDVSKPFWFDQYNYFYAVGKQSKITGDITYVKGYVYGAGCFVRKSVLEDLISKGFKNQLTDRVGTTLVSGGDNELGYMIAMSGYKIFYDPNLKFQHYIPDSRLSIKYMAKLAKGQQMTFFKIDYYESKLFNKTFKFPKSRFESFFASLFEILKLTFKVVLKKIEYHKFVLKVTSLFYKQLCLLLYFNTLKKELLLVQKNIDLI